MVDIRQLQYFVTSAQLGSFSEAAQALYTSQPHVSMVVRSLEQELGMTLVERRARIFPFYCIYAANQVYIGVLRGMGHTFSPMAVTVLCYCAFRIAWCSLLLPLWHDMRVIYLSYILRWVIMIILMAFCCRFHPY